MTNIYPYLCDVRVVPVVFRSRGAVPSDTANNMTLFGFSKYELMGIPRGVLRQFLNILSNFFMCIRFILFSCYFMLIISDVLTIVC